MRDLKKKYGTLLALSIYITMYSGVYKLWVSEVNQVLMLRQENASVCNPYDTGSYLNISW